MKIRAGPLNGGGGGGGGSMTLSPLHLQLVCGECTGTVVLWQRVG